MDGRFGSGPRPAVSLTCKDVAASTRFYEALFGKAFQPLADGVWRAEVLGGLELRECPPEGSGSSPYEFGVEDPVGSLMHMRKRGYVPLAGHPDTILDPDGRQIRIVAARANDGG